MKMILAAIAAILVGASAAQAQTMGITGSILTIGSSSEPFTQMMDDTPPWSAGLTFESKKSRITTTVERFSLKENAVATEVPAQGFSFLRGGTIRSNFLAVRGEMSWDLPIQNLLKVTASVGVFAGAAFVTGRDIGNEYATASFCDPTYCGDIGVVTPQSLPSLAPKATKGVNKPYLGLVVAGTRRIAEDAEVRLALDVVSTYDMKLRGNLVWSPKFIQWKK